MSNLGCHTEAWMHPISPLGFRGQDSKGGCGRTIVRGNWAHDMQKEKLWILRGLYKQFGPRSTFLQQGHVSLGTGKGTLPFRTFLQPNSIPFTLSELLSVSAPFPGLSFILGKQIPQKRDRVTSSCDWSPGKVLCGGKSIPFSSFWQARRVLSRTIGLRCRDARLAKPPVASHTRAGFYARSSTNSLKETVNQNPCLRENLFPL